MEIEEFIDRISCFIPFEVGLENDKLGLQVQASKQEVRKVLITYEVTSEVIQEAKEKQMDLILSFHPLIFFPLDRLIIDERVGSLLLELIQNSISLVVFHTNFDAVRGGTSWLLAERLGLSNLEFLLPNEKREGFGFGVVGEFENFVTDLYLLEKVQGITNSPIRWCIGSSRNIKKIAVVGGSGMNFAKNAYEKNVDAFLTADIKYHDFHYYKGKMMLIDPGHWETEYLVPFGMKKFVDAIFNDEITFFVSNIYTNPVEYFSKEEYNLKQKRVLLNNGV
ncbi:MAG: Nif3-like dinuclear metal center hexameric protein [Ignavibacteria bacterium]|nr:Nif3-like dinuclear metal center hexameric protein [Ignavibacteria bacterium]